MPSPRKNTSISHSVPQRLSSAARTRAYGRQFAGRLRPGDVVLLDGPLGSGKTTFTQGVAAGLGVKERVRSSSFMLVSEYAAAGTTLFHIDLYRLDGKACEAFGLEEYIDGGGICLIEWAERLERPPAPSCWRVSLAYDGADARTITVERSSRDTARGCA